MSASDHPDFDAFAARFGPRPYQALVPVAGIDPAHDAANDALVHAWRHWDRVTGMDNPEDFALTWFSSDGANPSRPAGGARRASRLHPRATIPDTSVR